MKPDAKYSFINAHISPLPKLKLYEHTGVDIPDFSPEIIEPYWSYSRSRMKSDLWKKKHPDLSLLGTNPPISLSYILEMRNFAYGHFKDDAVLVKFEWISRYELSRMHIWFFKDRRQEKEMLYEQWISCQLEL